jgi:hypothetical protein
MNGLKKILLLFFLWFVIVWARAQDTPAHRNFRMFEVRGFSGSHLYTGEHLHDALESGYWAINVRYGWQSSNPDGWQSMYLYPAYGIGWYNGFLGNPDLLGNPGAFFGFISFPLFYHHRHHMLLEPAFGISYDFEPFDSENNWMNDAIGSRFNIYFNLIIAARYRLNRETDLIYGLDLTHFSNGRTFRPNAGLNMFGFNVGVRYNFNTWQNKVDNRLHPEVILPARPDLNGFKAAERIRKGMLNIYGAGGVVQNMEDRGTRHQYGTASGLVELQYILNTKSAFTLGLDYFFDASQQPSQYVPNHFPAIHGGYDFRFWLMSIRLQAGTYLLASGRDRKGNFFLRPALRYDFSKHFFAQLGLKTLNGPRADWIETGLGTTFMIF